MTAPDATKPSVKDATMTTLTADMVKGGLSELEARQRAEQKAKDSHAWLMWAGFFVALALIVVGVALFLAYRVVMTGQSIPIVIAIMFAVGTALPVLVALFCATQASSEFVSLYLGNVFRIGRAVRGKDEPSKSNE